MDIGIVKRQRQLHKVTFKFESLLFNMIRVDTKTLVWCICKIINPMANENGWSERSLYLIRR